MTRARPRLVWIAAALVLVAVSVPLARRALPDTVVGTPAERRTVARTLVLTGRVSPAVRPGVGSSVGGIVREVLVREGDRVARGQLLVRVEDAQAAAALAQARASLAAAEARARASAERATLAERQAARDLERARTLHAAGAIAARDLEAAERAAADARAELEAARARAPSGGGAALAEVARARAAVDASAAQLALSRVTAPAAATVLERVVEPGDAVSPGQTLLELALDGPTELVAQAREESLADLRPGAEAVASADAFPGQLFAARVDRLAPLVDSAQGTVEVRLVVPDPPPYLRADMTVSLNVEVERRADALVVPRALLRDVGSASPWVAVARDGRAERRPVRVGIRGDQAVEIRDGLAEGELVLPADVEPGRRVRVTGAAGAAR